MESGLPRSRAAMAPPRRPSRFDDDDDEDDDSFCRAGVERSRSSMAPPRLPSRSDGSFCRGAGIQRSMSSIAAPPRNQNVSFLVVDEDSDTPMESSTTPSFPSRGGSDGSPPRRGVQRTGSAMASNDNNNTPNSPPTSPIRGVERTSSSRRAPPRRGVSRTGSSMAPSSPTRGVGRTNSRMAPPRRGVSRSGSSMAPPQQPSRGGEDGGAVERTESSLELLTLMASHANNPTRGVGYTKSFQLSAMLAAASDRQQLNSNDDNEEKEEDEVNNAPPRRGVRPSMSSRINACPRSPKRLSRRSDGATLRKMAKQSEELTSPRMSALAISNAVVHDNCDTAAASPPSLAPITA